jgi:hypothetical protein
MGIDFERLLREWNKIKKEDKPIPQPEPKPEPKPETQPDPEPIAKELTIIDMATIGDELRAYLNITSRDGYIWYAGPCRALGHNNPDWEGDGTPDSNQLVGRGDDMRRWLQEKVDPIIKEMKENSLATAMIIRNNSVADQCGNRIGLRIKDMLTDAGISEGRINIGEVIEA